MQRIGIIGQGFVGTAVRKVMSQVFDVVAYDKKWDSISMFRKEIEIPTEQSENADPYKILMALVDGPIFVCLPTPMNADGSCNISIVEEVIRELDSKGLSRCVVLKSTVPPGTTKRLNKQCKNVSVVFNPEFLTERSAAEDFQNQHHILIGGPRKATTLVKQMYQKSHPNVPVLKTCPCVAEMVKNATNCFLATKVSFANEVKQICDKMDIDYDKVVEYLGWDTRLGVTHWAVPGHDGRHGWGGSCFPKDMNSLMFLAKEAGVDPKVMQAAWDKNLEVRPERDWEMLKGRAVSE